MKANLLLITDDENWGAKWQNDLESTGFKVHLVLDTEQIDREIAIESPEVIVISGDWSYVIEIMPRLGDEPAFPIIVLQRSPRTADTVMAFQYGANDVINENMAIEEINARIVSLIRLFRRIMDVYSDELSFEDLRMELKSRKVFREGELIRLTPKEYELLRHLLKRVGEVCQREAILQEVWGYDFATGTNVVDVYIRHLRKKIDKGRARKLIHTVRGTGYMIQ
ncbi:response regulator transcription factor [Paenibacillus sp. D2_2]|uniref:response regulator transcription factor n=1 Tax=Paenibacillus sp. D2_2 TaxID=3073092 RepID=UPI002814C585|nr:response regulator transcription factor [Paenibacillus sp. D2_2]WMT42928.1 response regulator transcription factor [Paenibacillus sp. D2_2]